MGNDNGLNGFIMKTTMRLMTQLMMMEGLRLEAYRDAAGVLTIGYGHTGKDVCVGDRISPYWAKKMLVKDIQDVEREVDELNVAHTEGQLDALVSLAFNIGIERLKESTLLEVIREGGSKQQIKKEFKRWVYAGGKRLRGLELRREWEARRFFE